MRGLSEKIKYSSFFNLYFRYNFTCKNVLYPAKGLMISRNHYLNE